MLYIDLGKERDYEDEVFPWCFEHARVCFTFTRCLYFQVGILQKYLEYWLNHYTTVLTCSLVSDKLIYLSAWVFFFSIVITVSSHDLPKTKVFKSYQVINVVSGMYGANIGSIISSLTSVSGPPAVFLSTLSFMLQTVYGKIKFSTSRWKEWGMTEIPVLLRNMKQANDRGGICTWVAIILFLCC